MASRNVPGVEVHDGPRSIRIWTRAASGEVLDDIMLMGRRLLTTDLLIRDSALFCS